MLRRRAINSHTITSSRDPVYIVDGARTPFLKTEGKPGPFSPVDLCVQAGRPLLMRQPFSADTIDRVVLGCVNVVADEMNPARLAALRLGLPHKTPAYNVQINCGSGMLSIDLGMQAIQCGQAEMVLAGGAEALSHAPLLFRRRAVDWFASLGSAKTLQQKLKALSRFRPGFLAPEIGLVKGLTDPIVEMGMGQTAELLAHLFDISRLEADEYAARSHQRLLSAFESGRLKDEVMPLFAPDGRYFEQDNGIRPDSTPEKLAKLRPVFERPWGQVTAGNSSQVTDGANWVVLASERAVEKHGLTPMAKIVDCRWSALSPSIMGLGPALCSAELIRDHLQGQLDSVDLWEINEAFAAQVIACRRALADDRFCQDVLGFEAALGDIPVERLNIDGGAISLGHPVGASGNRIVLHLARCLKERGARYGIASQCVGGGQGGAMLVESVS